MSKIESLYGATPAEIFQSGLENLEDLGGGGGRLRGGLGGYTVW